MSTRHFPAPLFLSALALALFLFVLYNVNFRHGDTVDSISTTALPVSILREGNFDLDEFRALLSTHTSALEFSLIFGGVQERDGHLLSSYPFGAALFAVPFFWVADHLHYLREWHHYRVVGKIAASALVALSAVFIFLTLRQQLSPRAAWFLALLFGLGTSAWPVSSQELWQHGPGTLCLTIAVYALTRLGATSNRRFAFIAGLFLAGAVSCRLLNAIPTAALACFVLLHQRKYAVDFFAPLVAIGALLALYNWTTYGNLSGGYDAVYQSRWHAWRGLNSHNTYSNPLWQGLADVLISPSRGLFVYSPFLIPAYVAALVFFIRPPQPLYRYLGLWVILMSIVLAKNSLWWGGSSFGPRYFSETCVALTLLTGAVWQHLVVRKTRCVIFFTAALMSVFINGLGAFVAPCGWSDTPTLVDRDPARLWNWRDPEILRCLKVAVYNGAKPPEILLYKSGDTDL